MFHVSNPLRPPLGTGTALAALCVVIKKKSTRDSSSSSALITNFFLLLLPTIIPSSRPKSCVRSCSRMLSQSPRAMQSSPANTGANTQGSYLFCFCFCFCCSSFFRFCFCFCFCFCCSSCICPRLDPLRLCLWPSRHSARLFPCSARRCFEIRFLCPCLLLVPLRRCSR